MNDVSPLDLLSRENYNKLEQTAADRMAICKACPHLFAGMCRKCGCVMQLKTKLSDATCPEGKWLAEEK